MKSDRCWARGRRVLLPRLGGREYTSGEHVPRAALTGFVSAQIAMSNDKLRRQIACEAARLMYVRQESEYHRAKLTAARRLCRTRVKAADLPTNREIRDEIQSLARIYLYKGAAGGEPSASANGFASQDDAEGASREGLADVIPAGPEVRLDRFHVYETLLAALETVKQDPERHPEGDALYHSLQVFALAREAEPYDEEFQLAALLHDVGKAVDPRDHVAAALAALAGHVTERTAWLIEHHSEATALREGTLGARARRRLEAHDDFEHLMLLNDCDRQGRQRGAQVPDVQDALDHLRELARADGW
jgi:hypothetical protein